LAKVILGTNIILDYLSAGRPCHAEAVRLLEGIIDAGDVTPVVPAGCLKDAYYIMCRHYHNEPLVRERMDAFRKVVEVQALTDEVLDAAFASDEPDLEDAMVRATAVLLGAEAIITRDKSSYRGSGVPAMDAVTYCQSL
jgi:predicted nucleic acid-binding protein